MALKSWNTWSSLETQLPLKKIIVFMLFIWFRRFAFLFRDLKIFDNYSPGSVFTCGRAHLSKAKTLIPMKDYKRISQKERTAAIEMFGGKAGRKLLKEMNNTFTPGGDLESLKNR